MRQSELGTRLPVSLTEYLIYKTRQSGLGARLPASVNEYLLRIIFSDIEY